MNVQYARFQTLVYPEVLPHTGHKFMASGVKVNGSLQPIDDRNKIIYDNLYSVGAVLSGYNYITEKSGLGVAIGTGYYVGSNLSGG